MGHILLGQILLFLPLVVKIVVMEHGEGMDIIEITNQMSM
jgi:hypothetical protein